MRREVRFRKAMQDKTIQTINVLAIQCVQSYMPWSIVVHVLVQLCGFSDGPDLQCTGRPYSARSSRIRSGSPRTLAFQEKKNQDCTTDEVCVDTISSEAPPVRHTTFTMIPDPFLFPRCNAETLLISPSLALGTVPGNDGIVVVFVH